MNDKPVLNESESESLKCLTRRKAPFLKVLLLEDTLENVDLSLADPEGNTLHLLFFILFCSLTYLFYPLKDEAMILMFGSCYSYEVEGREATGVIKEKEVS